MIEDCEWTEYQYSIEFTCPICGSKEVAPKITVEILFDPIEVIVSDPSGETARDRLYIGNLNFDYNSDLSDNPNNTSFDAENIIFDPLSPVYSESIIKKLQFGCGSLECTFRFKQKSEASLLKYFAKNNMLKDEAQITNKISFDKCQE